MIDTFDSNGNKLFTFDPSREITRGGEGMIFAVPGKRNLAAKLYLPGVKPISEKKFEFLNKLDKNLFVRPEELLYSKQGKTVVGFTMEYVKQEFFPVDSIYNKNFCLQNSINYQVKEKIAKKLIEAVVYAHSINVIVGDLSGLNVLTNINGDIKFIDVDSYETPGFKHGGKLLDDIRDYLYQGLISKNSDYFALSVVCFNFFTSMHPFKGMHLKYAKLHERMIHKLPVFVKDKDLKLPKCYEPLTDNNLLQQYESLYLKGDRFILSVDKFIQAQTKLKIIASVITEGDLTIQKVFSGETIEYANFNGEQGLIRTKKEFKLYSTPQKGNVIFKNTLLRKEYQDVFLGLKNVVLYKNDKFQLFDKATQKIEDIDNISLPNTNKFFHAGNLLTSIDEDYMFILDLDTIRYKNIKYDRNKVFGDSFKIPHSIIQHTGLCDFLHFKQNNYMSCLRLPVDNVKGAIIRNDVGIVQYVSANQMKFQFFKIQDMKIEMMNLYSDSLIYFAYSGDNIKNSNIFVPSDEKILVYRAGDMFLISEINCSVVDTNSKLFFTNSGIIVVNEDEVFLVNKR